MPGTFPSLLAGGHVPQLPSTTAGARPCAAESINFGALDAAAFDAAAFDAFGASTTHAVSFRGNGMDHYEVVAKPTTDDGSLTSPGSTAISALARRRSTMRVGNGASGSVQVHLDEDGAPILAEKTIITFSEDKARTARQELAFATRQIGLEPQPACLVAIYSATHDPAENCTTILMECMDAGHAGRLGPVKSEPELAAMVRQVIAGLRVAHEDLRVIHRDLKPVNILLNTSGQVKIADFGVAALLGDGQTVATDQQGSILQMSPERLRGQEHGFPSDVWSLGVTVMQLATGKHPFVPAQCETTDRFWMVAEVIKHTDEDAVCEAATRAAVAAALAGCSAELRDFVDRCTAVDPAARATLAALEAHPFIESGRDVHLKFDSNLSPKTSEVRSSLGSSLRVVQSSDDWDQLSHML